MISFLRNFISENHIFRRWYSAGSGILAAFVFGFPARKFCNIGVTGTDGKTTTVEMISHVLRSSKKKVLSISTSRIVLDDNILPHNKRTTPGPWQLQRMFRKAQRNGITHVVLEVSSHALFQRRVFGIPLDVAVLTNITPEHLDYHKTLEKYAAAKHLLFSRHLRKGGTSVLNADDSFGKIWAKEFSQKGYSILTFSEQGDRSADYRSELFFADEKGISFTLYSPEGSSSVFIPVFGSFNVSNALSVLCVSRALGISEKDGIESLTSFFSVPGRMEKIESGKDFSIFIDFALTPGSLAKMLTSARDISKDGRLSLVFGSCGSHKDIEKRRLLGKIATKYADAVFVTDDEPYFENPEVIRKHILEGAYEESVKAISSGKVREIPDRKKAIFQAISEARSGDVVVVAGMGHLRSRNIAGKEISWSDEKIIREAIPA